MDCLGQVLVGSGGDDGGGGQRWWAVRKPQTGSISEISISNKVNLP